MTAKRGSMWKTSWKRKRPSIGTAPQDMYFFANFGDQGGVGEAWFEQALTTPSTGDGVSPYWIGAIFATSAPASDLDAQIARGVGVPVPTVPAWSTTLNWDYSALNLYSRALIATDGAPDPIVMVEGLTLLGAAVSPPLVRAVVQLITVEETVGGDTKLSLWIDGALRAVDLATGSYTAGAGRLFVRPKYGFLNSMAGGNGLPTTAQIQSWFMRSRYASPYPSAQEIVGMTIDRYDAANTPGVVPNPLVNLSTGQDAPIAIDGTPPVGVNVLLSTTFAY